MTRTGAFERIGLSMTPHITLACFGCGAALPGVTELPHPFRCPAARPGDDVDHVVRRRVDPVVWSLPIDEDANPFVRYRRRLYSWHVATAHGMSDAEFVDLVERLNDAVARVDGRGFAPTPLRAVPDLAAAIGASGGVWLKDETGNVSGSHKARHLMGLMLYLRVVDALRRRGVVAGEARPRRLAIASCGNAALGAAVVARAAGEPLEVFVPPWANASVVARLQSLGAGIAVCERRAGERGDPCYLRFKEALQEGAVPFCCQGPDNGLTIEGGETLAYELVDQLAAQGIEIGRLFVQVGGGALASACAQALLEARDAGRLTRLPRLHAVQTEGGHPLARAWNRLVAGGRPGARALEAAARHRADFMWPWETEPVSIAHGILDDETYDWVSVVEGMLETGGGPVLASEDDLRRANQLARDVAGVDADHTGSAGLAGLLRLAGALPGEPAAVLLTGVRRE